MYILNAYTHKMQYTNDCLIYSIYEQLLEVHKYLVNIIVKFVKKNMIVIIILILD